MVPLVVIWPIAEPDRSVKYRLLSAPTVIPQGFFPLLSVYVVTVPTAPAETETLSIELSKGRATQRFPSGPVSSCSSSFIKL